MIYLFYGPEKYLMNLEMNKILSEYNIEKINITYHDGDTELMANIIDDANTISLFSDKKAVIVNNSYFLSTKTNDNYETLLHYLNNINKDTLLFFITDKDKLDERKKVVKELKKVALVKEFMKSKNIDKIVLSMFDNYKINNSDLSLFIKRVGDDLTMIQSEVNKLKIYKDTDLEITTNDILDLTVNNIDTDIFNLIDNIVALNKVSAITSYHEMIKMGDEPIKIIITLANQLRLIYQSKNLALKGYTEADIAKRLNVHPYRVKLAITKGRLITNKKLLSYLLDLANLDTEIKTGATDSKLGLELFILSM